MSSINQLMKKIDQRKEYIETVPGTGPGTTNNHFTLDITLNANYE